MPDFDLNELPDLDSGPDTDDENSSSFRSAPRQHVQSKVLAHAESSTSPSRGLHITGKSWVPEEVEDDSDEPPALTSSDSSESQRSMKHGINQQRRMEKNESSDDMPSLVSSEGLESSDDESVSLHTRHQQTQPHKPGGRPLSRNQTSRVKRPSAKDAAHLKHDGSNNLKPSASTFGVGPESSSTTSPSVLKDVAKGAPSNTFSAPMSRDGASAQPPKPIKEMHIPDRQQENDAEIKGNVCKIEDLQQLYFKTLQKQREKDLQEQMRHRNEVLAAKREKEKKKEESKVATAAEILRKKTVLMTEQTSVPIATEFQKNLIEEREAMRRQKGLVSSHGIGPADPAIGRCCLRPGAPGDQLCEHSDINYEIRESQKRVIITCTSGCTMPYHFPRCYRKLSQDFKSKQLIPCITEGCPGYVKLAVSVEGGSLGASQKMEHYQMPKALEDQLKDEEAKRVAEKKARLEAQEMAKQKAKDTHSKKKKKGLGTSQKEKTGSTAVPSSAILNMDALIGRAACDDPGKARVAGPVSDVHVSQEAVQNKVSGQGLLGIQSMAEESYTLQMIPDDALLVPMVRRRDSEDGQGVIRVGSSSRGGGGGKSGYVGSRQQGAAVVSRLEDVAPAGEEVKGTSKAKGKRKGTKLSLDVFIGVPAASSAAGASSFAPPSFLPPPPFTRGQMREATAASNDALWDISMNYPRGADVQSGQEYYIHSETGASFTTGAYGMYSNLSGAGHWAGQQQQQQGQLGAYTRSAAPPRISEFPTLDQAVNNDSQVTGSGQGGDPDSKGSRMKYQDLILEGLQALKSDPALGLHGEPTALLAECLDVRSIQEARGDVQPYISDLFLSFGGSAPLLVTVFPEQEAVAVEMVSHEEAVTAYHLLDKR
ncbi:hypothetical protein CEUSTIGMA_g2891.t1 [Chlamydomonas eustigma]|uniref:Uncharacterized protein n=1 Tax=Chlamydomonas eustigma TaxID=1157962 RepID=A0A250WX86_9CHLO|nr:hypothetical protein CEUSTIGMA_g2891.t1 [Chlamydomonas eustigma]|eukprot:GAX75447.1 hypothetical protein CEUSTIGMA_g2891.t1 [Chlamydomonas eustigma]